MPTIHDQSNSTLDTVTGINGVQHGGSGRNKAADGPGFVYQASVGAEFTTVAPTTYIQSTGLDQTAEIEAAVNVSGAHRVELSSAVGDLTFLTSSTITMAENGVVLSGQGRVASGVKFVPALADQAAIEALGASGNLLQRITVRDLRLRSTDVTLKKIAVRAEHTTEFNMENVLIGPGGNWTGNGSIGLQLRGRDQGTVRNVTILADQPISIEGESSSSLDLDHWHFSDCYLGAGGVTVPIVKVEDGANLTNITFDGRQSWVSGMHGFYFSDTTTNQVDRQVVLENVRWEQGSGGYGVYYSTTSNHTHLTIRNFWCGTGTTVKGFYLRGCSYVALESCEYAGTSEALNVDGASVDTLILKQCSFLAGATTTMTNMTRVFPPFATSGARAGDFPLEVWLSTTSAIVSSHAMPMARIHSTYTGVNSTASATEQQLWAYSLPGGSLQRNGQAVCVEIYGQFAATANTKTATFYIGANAFVINPVTTAPNGRRWYANLVITRVSATTFNISGVRYTSDGATAGTVERVTLGIAQAATWSGDVILKLTGTPAVATADEIAFAGAVVTFLP